MGVADLSLSINVNARSRDASIFPSRQFMTVGNLVKTPILPADLHLY